MDLKGDARFYHSISMDLNTAPCHSAEAPCHNAEEDLNTAPCHSAEEDLNTATCHSAAEDLLLSQPAKRRSALSL